MHFHQPGDRNGSHEHHDHIFSEVQHGVSVCRHGSRSCEVMPIQEIPFGCLSR